MIAVLRNMLIEKYHKILGIHGCGVVDRNTHECDILGNEAKK